MKAHFFHYALGQAASAILSRRAAFFLAQGLGFLYASFPSKDRRAIRENLKCLFWRKTPAELDQLAKELIFNFSAYLVDLLYSRALTEDFIQGHVTSRGMEFLDQALSQGKGAILASAHLGNWELGGMTLGEMGYPIHCLAARHSDPRVDRLFCQRRSQHHLQTIPLGASVGEAYRVLRRNEVLALNADRLFGMRGVVRVRFFGRDLIFPQGLSRISAFTGAPVLPTFSLSLGRDRYLLEVESPLEKASPHELVQEFARRLEQKILRYPTQWFLFQPFWEAARWPI